MYVSELYQLYHPVMFVGEWGIFHNTGVGFHEAQCTVIVWLGKYRVLITFPPFFLLNRTNEYYFK